MQVSPIDKTKKATITSDPVKMTLGKKTVYTPEDVTLIKQGRARHGLTFSQAT